MPANQKILDDLALKADELSSVEDGAAYLSRLDDLEADGRLSKEAAQHYRWHCFEAIRELTNDDPIKAVPFVKELLLPLCLTPDETLTKTTSFERSRLREFLANWIDDVGDARRAEFRNEILMTLCETLRSALSRPALWTLARIGYRSEQVASLLRAFLTRQDDIGDEALSTLIALGVPPEDQPMVLGELRTRHSGVPRKWLWYAMQELPDPALVEIVWDQFDNPRDSSLAMGVLARIAAREPADVVLQERIWAKILRIQSNTSGSSRNELFLRSDVIASCNTPKVIMHFMRSLTEGGGNLDEAQHKRYLVYLRLQDCVRPDQLRGWEHSENLAALDMIRADACSNTRYEGRQATSESWVKEAAWQVALSLGTEEPLQWIEQAAGGEVNWYIKSSVLKAAACLTVHQLPDSVQDLITQEYDFKKSDSSGQLSARLAATRLARSAGTRAAFDCLLDFGLTMEGSTMRASSEALAAVSANLIRRGDSTVVESLMSSAHGGRHIRHRVASITALHTLATLDLLKGHDVDDFVKLATDKDLPLYARARTLEAIGFITADTIPGGLEALLRDQATLSDDDELSCAAVNTLTRIGVPTATDENLLRRVGLARQGDSWVLAGGVRISPYKAFAIGVLYRHNPEVFASLVSSFLKDEESMSIQQLFYQLDALPVTDDGSVQTPARVVDALVSRIRTMNQRAFSETHLFRILSQIDPSRLVLTNWEERWPAWHTEARVALAVALGEARCSLPRDIGRRAVLLIALVGDGTYAVRRAAYRALAIHVLAALAELSDEWSRSPSVEKRKRAAEAAGWIPDHGHDGSVLTTLLVDPELSVRGAARQALNERRDRAWANEYLERVRSVRSSENSEILEAYRYGQALVRIGDDTHRQQLQRHISETVLPPNVRYWLTHLDEQIEKRWRETTRKWPEPWFSWENTVEEVDGYAILEDQHKRSAHFSLWRREPATPSDSGDWGGAVSTGASLSFDAWTSMPGTIDLEIPGRRSSSAVVTREFGSGILLITGSSPYPTPSSPDYGVRGEST